MFNFLRGYLFGSAVAKPSFVRVLLLLVLAVAFFCGIVYAFIVFNAVQEGSSTSHVHTHSAR
jgi:hypothetical protein